MQKNEQRVVLWQKRLRQWENSGKSGPQWAKDQQIPYHTFCYWRNKLAEKAEPFVELIDIPKSHQELLLEWQGFTIRISNNFDACALKRFLQVLREL